MRHPYRKYRSQSFCLLHVRVHTYLQIAQDPVSQKLSPIASVSVLSRWNLKK